MQVIQTKTIMASSSARKRLLAIKAEILMINYPLARVFSNLNENVAKLADQRKSMQRKVGTSALVAVRLRDCV
jgi:hypothetical protein